MTTSFTLLHRAYPERNEKYFYAVMVGASLVDPHAVIRFWGRVGSWQRMVIRPFATPEAAEEFAVRLITQRLNHGYQNVEF